MAPPRYDDAVDLLERAQRMGDAATLDDAVDGLRRIIEESPGEPVDTVVALSVLSVALHTRYTWTGRVDDLDEAVATGRRAATACPQAHPHRAAVLANLANTLRIRFERTDHDADINEAIDLGRTAADLPLVEPVHRVIILSNLAICLRIRSQHSGSLADVDQAITAGQQAVGQMPDDFPDRAAVLSNLAGAHQVRFERTGEPGHLDQAIRLGRLAVQAATEGSPHEASVLANLCAALHIRSERTSDTVDLDQAIDAGRAAVAATAAGHPDLPARLANLSAAYLTRFERTDEPSDVNAAVDLAQRAVDGTAAGEAARAGRLSNLAAALRSRFEQSSDRADVDRAITAARQAVQAMPATHPGRSGLLSNLGTGLRARFRHTRDPADARYAETALRQALEVCPVDHPERAVLSSNLGGILYDRFEVTGEDGLPRAAIDAFRHASTIATARPRVRVAASTAWGRIAADLAEWPSAADGLALAVGLLGQLAPRELDQEDQQRELARHAAVAADAAACAVQIGLPERALALLEQGRGILLSQAIDVRGELTDLLDAAPELAGRFDRLRRHLDAPDVGGMPAARSARPGAAETATPRRRLVEELDTVVELIRAVPGFADFLRPPPIAELLDLAALGPVVAVNVSELRCDALLVDRAGVRAVPLPAADPAAIRDRAVSIADGLDPGLDRTGDEVDGNLADVLDWLWQAIAMPVLDALDLRRPDRPGRNRPRLWWMPTGVLSFLPLHAAQPSDGSPGLLDYAISSYTPTLRALAFARSPGPIGPPRVLAVAAPDAAGRSPLPGAARETSLLTHLTGDRTSVLADDRATRSTVLAALADHTWAHFACHAESHPIVPSRSGLVLSDRDGRPLSVADIARLRLASAELAYLSACATTRTAATLSDEAIHITSAFQLAGYRHVIGTLWPVRDSVAARMARTFYAAATSAEGRHPDRIPAAVDAAVTAMRQRLPHRPSAWAAYIHAGA